MKVLLCSEIYFISLLIFFIKISKNGKPGMVTIYLLLMVLNSNCLIQNQTLNSLVKCLDIRIPTDVSQPEPHFYSVPMVITFFLNSSSELAN